MLIKPYLRVRCRGTKMYSSADASQTVIRKVKGQCINLLSVCSFQPLPPLCIIDELEHSLSSFPSAQSPWTVKNGAPQNLLQLPFGCGSQCALHFPLCTFGGLFRSALTKARKCNLLYSAALEPIFCSFFCSWKLPVMEFFFFFCHVSKSCYTWIQPTKISKNVIIFKPVASKCLCRALLR